MKPTPIGAAILAGLLALTGCGYDNSTTPEPVEISGTLKGPVGTPLTSVTLFFQPAEKGILPAQFPLKSDGTFGGKITPGTYTYYVGPASDSDKKGEAVAQKLPESYKRASADRTVKVKGGTVELKF